LANEIQSLRNIHKVLKSKFDVSKALYISSIIDYGLIVLKNHGSKSEKIDKPIGYYIMPKYSQNLEQYFCDNNDPRFMFMAALQIIEAFEIVHKSGRTYNDLKPQNVMISKDADGKQHVVLIDFGFCRKFKSTQGIHISHDKLRENFQGNILFSSIN
jgi:serine/threonine protein kinase